MHNLRRATATVGLLLVGVWLSTATVAADGKPDRSPLPPPDTLVDNFCGDLGPITVSADAASFNAELTVFTRADGTVELRFTGHQRAIVQGNGKTLTFDTSGPGSITFFPDGTVTAVGQGHLIYIGPPGSAQPGLFLYSGLTVLDISNPIATVSSYHGDVTDICAELR